MDAAAAWGTRVRIKNTPIIAVPSMYGRGSFPALSKGVINFRQDVIIFSVATIYDDA